MVKNNTEKKPASASPNMKQLVQSLIEANGIDNSGLPDDFDSIDAVAFVKELARYREKALGTPRYRNLIRTSAWNDAGNANALLKVLSRAQPDVTGKVMEAAVDAIEISLDYGFLGGDVFTPRLMPNGSILIRNHHRAIAIDEAPSLLLPVNNSVLRKELERIVSGIESNPSDEDAIAHFSIIHRHEDRAISVSRDLPEELSDWGQTLILIDGRVNMSESTILSESGISDVCTNSRTGTAIIRVFKHHSLVYGTYRASDDFDTILEEFAICSFEKMGVREYIEISQDQKKVRNIAANITRNIIESIGLNKPDTGAMAYYFDRMMTSIEFGRSYASKKADQISSFPPIFDEKPGRPVFYYDVNDPLWNMSSEFSHKFAAVDLPMGVFASFDDFEQNFVEAVRSRIWNEIGFPPANIFVLIENAKPGQGKEFAHSLESDSVKRWIKARADEMRANLAEEENNDPDLDRESCVREIFNSGGFDVTIIMVFAETPDYVSLNKLMMQASSLFDSGCRLYVPCVGFAQGYYSGEYDSGNGNTLVPRDEYENSAHDDEDDDFEEDEEDEE